MGERKFVQTIQLTWPRWSPCPSMVKTINNLLLRNQKAEDLETWYAALGAWVLPNLFKWWLWVDLDLFYSKVKFAPLCFPVFRCPQGISKPHSNPFLDVIFPSLLLSSSPSCSFHCPLQNCLRHVRGSWDLAIPSEFPPFYHGKEIIMHSNCILDSVANLLVRHMVFVGNVQKSPI